MDWFREEASENARRMLLAGVAAEERPDEQVIHEMRLRAIADGSHAIAPRTDEAFSTYEAAEVAYIYGLAPDTLRGWKRRYRAGLASGRPGAPRRKPVRKRPLRPLLAFRSQRHPLGVPHRSTSRSHPPAVADGLVRVGFEIVSQVIWDKGLFAIGRSWYHWSHEPCWVVRKAGSKVKFLGSPIRRRSGGHRARR